MQRLAQTGWKQMGRQCGTKATGTVHAAAAASAFAARGGCSAASTVRSSATTGGMLFARRTAPAAAGWTQEGMSQDVARTLRVHVLFPIRAMSSPASGNAGSADKTDKVKHEVSPAGCHPNLTTD